MFAGASASGCSVDLGIVVVVCQPAGCWISPGEEDWLSERACVYRVDLKVARSTE